MSELFHLQIFQLFLFAALNSFLSGFTHTGVPAISKAGKSENESP